MEKTNSDNREVSQLLGLVIAVVAYIFFMNM